MITVARENWDGADGSAWPAQWTPNYTSNSTGITVPTIVGGKGRQIAGTGISWGYSSVIETVFLPKLGTTWDITVDITVHDAPSDDWFVDIFPNGDNTVVNAGADMSPGNGLQAWFGYDTGGKQLYGQLGRVVNSASVYGDYTPLNIPFTLGQDISVKYRLRRNGSLVQAWIWGANDVQPVDPVTEYTLDAPCEGQYLSLGLTNGANDIQYAVDWDNLVVSVPVATEKWDGADGSAWPAQWRTDIGGSGMAGSFDTSSNRGREVGGVNYGAARAYLAPMPMIADTDLTVTVTLGDEPELYIGVWISSDGVFLPGSDLYPSNCYLLEMGTLWGPVNNGSYIWAGRIVGGAKNGLLQPWDHPTDWVATAKSYALTSGVPYKIRLQRSGTTVRMKVWLASDPEPTDWNFSAVEDPAHMPPPGRIGISVGGADQTGTAYFDDLIVDADLLDMLGYIADRPISKAFLGDTPLAGISLG